MRMLMIAEYAAGNVIAKASAKFLGKSRRMLAIDPNFEFSYHLRTVMPTPNSYASFAEGSRFRAFISNRHWGDTGASGDPTDSKQSFVEALSPGKALVVCKQVHSLRILVLQEEAAGLSQSVWQGFWGDSPRTGLPELRTRRLADLDGRWPVSGPPFEGDGILTDCPGLVPGVSVADCLPVALGAVSGRHSPVRGILHSGWQGTGILQVAVEVIQTIWNIPPEDLEFGIGPGICAAHYPITQNRSQVLRSRFGAESLGTTIGTGEFAGQTMPSFDMHGANEEIARKFRLRDSSSRRACTYEDAEYFSHRRDGADRFKAGRNFAIVVPKE